MITDDTTQMICDCCGETTQFIEGQMPEDWTSIVSDQRAFDFCPKCIKEQ